MILRRLITVLFVLFVLAGEASAYTLVLRDGVRVDIGEFYWLSGSAVTWVTSRGERRSVDLSRLDLDATARFNGEGISTFIDRAVRRGAVVTAQTAAAARRDAAEDFAPAASVPPRAAEDEPITITTADIAPYREERERSEAERRTSTALPAVGTPPVDSGRDDAAIETEERWREEARALREELDSEQAQIDALFGELAYREANPRKFRLSNEYNYGRGIILADQRGYYRYPGRYYSGSSYNRADEEFAQLNSRLIDLEIQHRGTLSRWDTFLERARRADVPPGWLR